MGTFYAKCSIEDHVDRKKSIVIPKLLVDRGSEYTWVPEHLLGKIDVAREKGEKGDMVLLGARTLEGLNLAVDPRQKKLVAAGPFPAAGNFEC